MLFLRRLRLPLPLTSARCRCRQLHDLFGGHLATCPQSGVLRAKGGPLERAAALTCREAAEPPLPSTLGFVISTLLSSCRRIDVIANGLALWGGSQLAVDTALVSLWTSASARGGAAGRTAGAAFALACKDKERTYPAFRQYVRSKLVVVALELGSKRLGLCFWLVRLAILCGCLCLCCKPSLLASQPMFR